MKTPLDVIEAQAVQRPDAPAIIYAENPTDSDVRIVTYSELATLVRQVSEACVASGIKKADIVALQLLATPEAIVSLFAVMSVACAFPVNILLNQDAFDAQLEEAGVKHVFTMADYPQLPLASKVAGLETQPDLMVEIPVSDAETHTGWQDFLAAGADSGELPSRTDNENCIMFATGGTTGKPKLALLGCRAAIEGAKTIATGTASKEDDRILSGFPLFHVGGTIAVSLSAATTGSALVQVSPLGARHPDFVPSIWAMVERLKLTFISMVPTSLSVISNVPVEGHDISSLRTFNTGGSKMPVPVAEKLEAMTGAQVHELYGMTECAAAGVMNHRGRRVLGSAGEPLKGVTIAIGDPEKPSQTGQIGEIFIQSPGNFNGYLKKQNTEEGKPVPWVATGDLGYIGENGRLYVTGRSKDLIIRSGHNIQPVMIEEVAESHPDVALAAAVAYPDDYAGEVPALFVQLNPDAQSSTDELLEFVRARVSEPPAKPKYIFIIDEMPLTNVGKIFKPKLREIIAGMQ